jgi:hypothetical protein
MDAIEFACITSPQRESGKRMTINQLVFSVAVAYGYWKPFMLSTPIFGPANGQ